jgi:hypothetical protein
MNENMFQFWKIKSTYQPNLWHNLVQMRVVTTPNHLLMPDWDTAGKATKHLWRKQWNSD